MLVVNRERFRGALLDSAGRTPGRLIAPAHPATPERIPETGIAPEEHSQARQG